MLPHFFLEAPIGLSPVLLFLLLLLSFDSYKLVSLGEVLVCLAAGMGLAVLSYYTNTRAINALHYSFATYSRFAAPVAEEFLKAGFIIVLFAINRIGFMIDAAIMGFAVGAGFALSENLYYLAVFPGANLGVWIVRGFGTAIMHGGATAIFGVLGQGLTERRPIINPLMLLPGLGAGIVVHGIYNTFQDQPSIAAASMVLVVPFALLIVFSKSEHKIHTWLLTDYESHEHILEAIANGEFANSEAGHFIASLSRRFDPDVVADLFEYMRLHAQLVMRAEKISLGREKGEKVTDGHQIHELFKRLHALEKKIGRVAMMAVWPHLHFTRRELWELNELEGRFKHA
jgi:RsiW-degrading membrane proteinase PrsW (M82 family)